MTLLPPAQAEEQQRNKWGQVLNNQFSILPLARSPSIIGQQLELHYITISRIHGGATRETFIFQDLTLFASHFFRKFSPFFFAFLPCFGDSV